VSKHAQPWEGLPKENLVGDNIGEQLRISTLDHTNRSLNGSLPTIHARCLPEPTASVKCKLPMQQCSTQVIFPTGMHTSPFPCTMYTTDPIRCLEPNSIVHAWEDMHMISCTTVKHSHMVNYILLRSVLLKLTSRELQQLTLCWYHTTLTYHTALTVIFTIPQFERCISDLLLWLVRGCNSLVEPKGRGFAPDVCLFSESPHSWLCMAKGLTHMPTIILSPR
jgi:hypothetical protein